jgi:FHA domain-containing protein/zinc ribbon protein
MAVVPVHACLCLHEFQQGIILMQYCPKCNAPLEGDDSKFCPACGTEVGSDVNVNASADCVIDAAPDDIGSAVSLDDAEEIVRTPEGVREQYGRGVAEALADGVIDPDERARLNAEAAELGMSPGDARKVEEQVFSTMIAPDVAEDVSAGTCPVRLELNRNRFYMGEKGGCLQFRMLARSGKQRVQLVVHSNTMGCHDKKLRISVDGGPRVHIFQVVPQLPGEIVLDVSLRVDADALWTGQIILPVLQETENLQNLQITINQSVHAEKGGKAGYGVIMRNELDKLIESGQVRTVNDVLGKSFPDFWEPIGLFEEEDDEERSVQRHRVLDSREHPTDRLAIHWESGLSGRLLLLAREEIHMGRLRECNDIVTRILPRNPDNDRRSVAIQHRNKQKGPEPHATITLSRRGLQVIDHDTDNGTCLDGADVEDKPADLSLTAPSELHMARVLQLRLVPFSEDAGAPVPRASHFDLLGRADELWRTAERQKLRSLLIERLNNLAEEERYLLVYRWACIGRGTGNEITATDADLSRVHARIIRRGGGFWIEALNDDHSLLIDDHVVERGQAAPLAPGMSLRCGDLRAKIAEYTQYGL